MSEETTQSTETAAAESTTSSSGKAEGMLKVMCILSVIGSSFTSLIGLLGLIAGGWIMGMMGIGAAAANEAMVNAGAEGAEVAEAMGEASGIMGYWTIIMIVVLLFGIVSIMGALKMMKLNKKGFFMYAVPNIILTVLLLIGGSWFTGIISLGFIAYYGSQMKNMK